MSKQSTKFMTIGALVLLAGVASARGVVATPPSSDINPTPTPVTNIAPAQAPEIDAAPLLSAVTLLLGGLVVLRGRKA